MCTAKRIAFQTQALNVCTLDSFIHERCLQRCLAMSDKNVFVYLLTPSSSLFNAIVHWSRSFIVVQSPLLLSWLWNIVPAQCCFTFTFKHLADTFIQSDLHCIQVTVFTFYELLLSLGIQPMVLALLAPCSTIWATGKLCCHQVNQLISAK